MKQSRYLYVYLIVLCFFLCSCQSDKPIRIACIGDSITYGSYLTNPTQESYPARLQQIFGQQVEIGNFGISGSTISFASKDCYWNTQNRLDSEVFSPDIVLFMMGTNDSIDQNWQSKEAFLQDLDTLLTYYQNISSKPHVYVLTPSSSFILEGNDDLVRGMHQKRIAIIRETIMEYAEEKQLDIIDIYTLTNDVPQYYVFDGVHPNREGARFLADRIASFLKQHHKLSLLNEN